MGKHSATRSLKSVSFAIVDLNGVKTYKAARNAMPKTSRGTIQGSFAKVAAKATPQERTAR